MRPRIGMAVLVSTLLFLALPAAPASATTVAVPDAALLGCLNAELERPATTPVVAEDLAGLGRLVCRRAGVRELTGLAGLSRATSIDLGDNRITDLTPLAALTALRALDVGGNAIASLEPLRGLDLDSLVVDHNPLDDLAPVSALTNLSVLRARGIDLDSVAALAPLGALTDLDLSGNRIADLTPLAGLTSLTNLALSDNRITDVSPLGGLGGGYGIWQLDRNRILDLSPLSRTSAAVFAADQLIGRPPLAAPGWLPLSIIGLDGRAVAPAASGSGSFRDGRLTLSRTGIHRVGFDTGTGFSGTIVVTVGPEEPTSGTAPLVLGPIEVGSRLRAGTESWDPEAELTYQWQRDGGDIPGATRASYLVAGADAGTSLTVVVTGTAPGRAIVTLSSDPAVVPFPPLPSVAPTILPTTDS